METKNKWSWLLCMKGVAMGVADVVPGVSGGTIALLLGIYDQFITSLAQITPKTFLDLFKGRIAPSLVFLANLGIGIGAAVVVGARLIHYCLDKAPEFVWGIFLVLVLSSLVILMKKEKLTLKSWALFLAGGLIAYFVNQLVPQYQAISYLNVFIGGFFAIFAMMLPGVSGSFLLLVLGLYHHIIMSLKSPLELSSIKTLGVLGAGALLGLVLGSRLLKALLRNYRHETLMVLLGFMLGSSPKLWPWQGSSFTLNYYNISVVIIMIVSLVLFYFLSRLADLKESETCNKIAS